MKHDGWGTQYGQRHLLESAKVFDGVTMKDEGDVGGKRGRILRISDNIL